MLRNHPIKAVLFDLDGTLRHHLPKGSEVFVGYLRSLNIPISHEDETRAERWEHFYFAHSLEIQQDREAFKDNSKAFWVNYSKRRLVALGLEREQAARLAPEVSEYMGANYKPEAYVPKEAPLMLAMLKQAGYTLGVLSNRDEPYHEELKNLRLDPFFDFSLAAGEVQSFKPEPRIFQRGLELAGSAAHETIYVGDNYFADIVGSHRAGLAPVLFDPNRLFPDAGCDVIRSFDELPDLLMQG
ncbi:MAG: HAD family hydrolase [Chloroflexi bacterium]|nr:HAD family hydrolase [Chloroflexota bacterium]